MRLDTYEWAKTAKDRLPEAPFKKRRGKERYRSELVVQMKGSTDDTRE